MYKFSWYPFMCNPEAVSTAGFEDILADKLQLDGRNTDNLIVVGYLRDDAGNWPLYRVYFELGTSANLKKFFASANACGVRGYWNNSIVVEKLN